MYARDSKPFAGIAGFFRQPGINTNSSTITATPTKAQHTNKPFHSLKADGVMVLGHFRKSSCCPTILICLLRIFNTAHFPPPGNEDDFVFEGFRFADV